MLQSKACLFICMVIIITICPNVLHASGATLQWNPNSEPDLAGYKVFYGKTSGTYSDIYDVGSVTEYTVSNLEEGATYYFALKAYDHWRNESDFSEEISYTVEEGANEDLSLLNPNGGEKVQVGSRYVVEWEAIPEIEYLCIFLSTDSGESWTKINPSTPNDGSWRWDVPDILSDQCLLRLEELRNPGRNDVSASCFSVVESPVVVDNDGENGLPRVLTLNQNYPNPFNPMTTISFSIPEDEEVSSPQPVSLAVYDERGRKVRQLVEAQMIPGRYSVVWDGRTEYGNVSPSGIYFYALAVNENFLPPRKMVLAR